MESSAAVADQVPLPSHTKYSNLPDVDISAQDLYESGKQNDTQDASRRKNREQVDGDGQGSSDSADDSDSPASASRKHRGAVVPGASSNDIDSNSLSRTNAAAKFGRATDLDGTRVDFSGRVRTSRVRKAAGNSVRPRDAGFETNVYSLDSRRQESAVDRLRRLKYETNLLEEELTNQQAASRSEPADDAKVSPQEMVAQLQAIHLRLSELDSHVDVPNSQDLTSLVQTLSQSSTATLSGSKGVREEDQEPPKDGHIASIDSRLSQLETVLGFQQSTSDEEAVPRPLLATLARLESQLALLSQPRHLDTISRRVKVLVTEMDRVRDVRKDNAVDQSSSSGTTSLTPSDTTQLEHLFQVANRLEPLLPIMQPVLSRLQTLSDVHGSAAQFKTSLDGLQAKAEAQRQQTSELNQLLANMEANVEQNRTTMQTNLESLQARISDVSVTLQGLQ